MGGIDDFMGNFNNPAVVPNIYAAFTDHMNFGQRILNSLLYLFNLITYHYYHLPQQNEVSTKRLYNCKFTILLIIKRPCSKVWYFKL